MALNEYAKQTVEQWKKEIIQAVKVKLIPIILIIVLVLGFLLIIIGIFGIDEADAEEEAEKNQIESDGSISLTTPILSQSDFKKALTEYYDKTKNENLKKYFVDNADLVYTTAVSSNVNPELVVVTAKAESNFNPNNGGGAYNFYGIGVYNGNSSGGSYSSMEEGIQAYAKTLEAYNPGGTYASSIIAIYDKRKDSGCDSTGYGLPGTFSGMQSIYSSLGKHEEGSSGAGGYYYMDPAVAGVTKIYKTHEEFLSKCKNAGGEHELGKKVTDYEGGQYTAWQCETKINYWKEIFGKYGSIGITNNGEEKKSDTKGIKGYYTSGSTGKTYTEYYQNIDGSDWYATDGCFHCSIATIISGYGSNKTPNELSGFKKGSGCYGNQSDISKYGNCTYTTVTDVTKDKMKTALKNKHTLMIHVVNNTIKTDNGSSYHKGHWLVVLDYKEVNGKAKGYVHDPWSGDKSYGWGDLSDIASATSEYYDVKEGDKK